MNLNAANKAYVEKTVDVSISASSLMNNTLNLSGSFINDLNDLCFNNSVEPESKGIKFYNGKTKDKLFNKNRKLYYNSINNEILHTGNMYSNLI